MASFMTSLLSVNAPALVVAAGDNPLSHVLAHPLFGSDWLTNHLLMLFVSAVLLVIFLPLAAAKKGPVPSGFRNFLESIMQYIREEVARPVLGHDTDEFMPFLWTTFFLILTANLLGMIPLGMMAAPIDARLQHLGGTATGNIGVTLGFAICAFVMIHVSGMRKQGVVGYWKNFFFGHAPIFLAPLMVPLEIIGALVKPFALCVRLFANMTAGHVILAVLMMFAVQGAALGGMGYGITVASVLGSVAISLLELFVAFLQAYIFTFLTTLFIGAAVHVEH